MKNINTLSLLTTKKNEEEEEEEVINTLDNKIVRIY